MADFHVSRTSAYTGTVPNTVAQQNHVAHIALAILQYVHTTRSKCHKC